MEIQITHYRVYILQDSQIPLTDQKDEFVCDSVCFIFKLFFIENLEVNCVFT